MRLRESFNLKVLNETSNGNTPLKKFRLKDGKFSTIADQKILRKFQSGKSDTPMEGLAKNGLQIEGLDLKVSI